MWDELDEPLGFASGAAAAMPVRRKRPTKGAAIGAVILAMAIGLLTVPRRELSLNGEPFALAKVEVLAAPRKPDAPEATASVRQTSARPLASQAQVESTSGVKVTRGSDGAPKALIIDVAQALGVKLAPAPDARLIEKSKYGLLPRIGVDGARPFEAYARAVVSDPRLSPGSPRIALVVGGFGLNPEAAESAIAKLPGAVTLGFSPSGRAVEQQAAEAREAGHETVLQARLDDVSNLTGGLGAHVLSTSASDAENLDSLRWQMGQLTGYVAVASNAGGKFTADEQHMSPIMKEITDRGLGYLDDGAPPGSRQDISASAPMPLARADLVIDANAAPEAVDASLSRLVELAHERGSAIGVASVTTGRVERLARWTNGLDAKGVALVPLSALMSARPGLSAQSNPSVSP